MPVVGLQSLQRTDSSLQLVTTVVKDWPDQKKSLLYLRACFTCVLVKLADDACYSGEDKCSMSPGLGPKMDRTECESRNAGPFPSSYSVLVLAIRG